MANMLTLSILTDQHQIHLLSDWILPLKFKIMILNVVSQEETDFQKQLQYQGILSIQEFDRKNYLFIFSSSNFCCNKSLFTNSHRISWGFTSIHIEYRIQFARMVIFWTLTHGLYSVTIFVVEILSEDFFHQWIVGWMMLEKALVRYFVFRLLRFSSKHNWVSKLSSHYIINITGPLEVRTCQQTQKQPKKKGIKPFLILMIMLQYGTIPRSEILSSNQILYKISTWKLLNCDVTRNFTLYN